MFTFYRQIDLILYPAETHSSLVILVCTDIAETGETIGPDDSNEANSLGIPDYFKFPHIWHLPRVHFNMYRFK